MTHKPTKKNRDAVIKARKKGATLSSIAVSLKISLNSLKKYYSQEINEGTEHIHDAIESKLYQIAIKEGNVAALIFLAKTRLGWSETKNLKVEDVTPKLNITLNAIEAEDDGD